MSSSVRVVPEDELSYARERVVAWCIKQFPEMTLAMAQHIAILVAVERSKAIAQVVPPRRERRVAMPITLPAMSDEDEVTEPRNPR